MADAKKEETEIFLIHPLVDLNEGIDLDKTSHHLTCRSDASEIICMRDNLTVVKGAEITSSLKHNN